MPSRALAVLTVVIAGSRLSGCGNGDGSVLHSGESIVLVGEDLDGDAIGGFGYSGDVAMAGACVDLDGTTVIWPHGTKIVSGDPLTIDVPGQGRLTVGDHVDGGGQRYAAGYLPKGIDAIPSGCPCKQLVAFYSNQ